MLSTPFSCSFWHQVLPVQLYRGPAEAHGGLVYRSGSRGGGGEYPKKQLSTYFPLFPMVRRIQRRFIFLLNTKLTFCENRPNGCWLYRVFKCTFCFLSQYTQNRYEDNCGVYWPFEEERNVPVECNSDESHTPGTFCVKVLTRKPCATHRFEQKKDPYHTRLTKKRASPIRVMKRCPDGTF